MNSQIKIQIVSQYFYPDVAATGQLLSELSIELSRLGCKVVVLTAQPSYSGNKKTIATEVVDGVIIYRTWATRFDKNFLLGRITNSLLFFISVFIKLLRQPNDSILMLVSNPPFLPFIGYFFSILKKRKYVWLVNDIYPDIAVQLNYLKKGGYFYRGWNLINKLIYQKASAVVVLSESMRNTLVKKFHKYRLSNSDKIFVIHNWVNGNFIKVISKDDNPFAVQHSLRDKFIVLYSGNFGLSHPLETIILSANKLKHENICFIFIGDGAKQPGLMKMTEEMGLSNIQFFPYQPRNILPFSLTCSDISIVALEKGIDGLSMPSKFYSILASGKPVIALVESTSEVANIIRAANCGVSIEQNDADSLANIIRSYYADAERIRKEGANGRQYFEDHYTLEKSAMSYFNILKNISTECY
ncbi:MAG: glycosyltransferase family 4 protein [Bacteroidota bacterium]|nr:glycosyltransferase family 4 protein [Bacteroidota bacterium]